MEIIMERPPTIGSPRKLKTNLLCIPKLKTTNTKSSTPNNKAAKALLERLREAILRLIMLSALNGSHNRHGHVAGSTACDHRRSHVAGSTAFDHRHSEAVADCIEFIKKKAGPEEIARGSSASEGVATPQQEEM